MCVSALVCDFAATIACFTFPFKIIFFVQISLNTLGNSKEKKYSEIIKAFVET